MPNEKTGKIGWFDLTVENADEVKEFYSKVAGWKTEPVKMDGYNDYNMNLPASNETVAGICHKRGSNEKFPSQWLLYINVDNIDESLSNCVKMGGEIIDGPKSMEGYGKYCVIKDPAGAFCALFEPIS